MHCRGDLVGIQQCDIHARSNMPGVAAAAVDGVVVGGDGGGGGAEPQNEGVAAAAADGDAENERQKLIRCAHLLY